MSKENLTMKIQEPINETEEEKVIKTLVDDIYDYEEKILEINSYLEKCQTNDNDNNLSLLRKKENSFKDKLNLINIKANDDIKKKQNIISAKQKILNDIENQINIYISKLSEFNTLSFNSLIMTKYIISNNLNEFLTKEQIDDIINNSVKEEDKKENINDNNNLENNLNKEINKIKDKMNQIKEKILMMKEEKIVVNNEIIELISKKETVDSLVKSSLINLNENINLNNNNNIILPEIQEYELNFIDTNKISKNICNELYELFDIKNKEMNKNNISDKELSLNISAIKSKNEEENNLNKKNLEILIKSELDTFLLNQIKNKEIINSLMNNLCIIISTKLQLLNIDEISSDKLKAYLIYYFKSIYYDNIIENKFKFINKEYKILKKEKKKYLQTLKDDLSIIETKKEEVIKNKNSNIQNKNINNKGIINLTKNEQEYIQICSKGNSLIKQKEEIKNIINKLEKEIEKIKLESKEETDKITKELNVIKEQINNLTNNEDKMKIKLNEDIINYRKIISDKFSLIKEQLQNYKTKYGSNLGIYNRLIEGINDTIKLIYKGNDTENNDNFLNEKKNNFDDILMNQNNYNIINKLISLTKGSECYFREISNNSMKYNPIENQNSYNSLCGNPFYFSKAIIILNKSYDSISFNSNNMNYYYNIEQIDNTIMNSNLKNIIDIHRDYRKYKNNKNNRNVNMNEFIKREKLKYLNFNNEFIEKSAINKCFNFSLLINEGRRIEIILCNYEDFKLWINGFAFIIKNKNQIIKMNKNNINK